MVIPLLDEERNVEALIARLWHVLDAIGEPFEVIAVDDGSTDSTPEILRREAACRPGLRCIRLARNFGQHAAIMAGFDVSAGEWIITIDGDLQNPPEEIHRVVQKLREGHDMVGTYREGRKDTFFRRAASWIVNRVIRNFSKIDLKDFGCALRGYSSDVVRAIARHPEYRTFIPALGTLYASNPVEIPVTHARRAAGDSKYSLFRLVSLALDLLTCFSLWPLRFLFLCGSLVSVLGVGFGVTLLLLRWAFGAEWAAQGSFTLFAILFIFIGAQFIAFGLLGEYIGRIFQEVRHRPVYVVRKEARAPQAITGNAPKGQPQAPEGNEAHLGMSPGAGDPSAPPAVKE